jgi:hypothetical protein
MNSIKTIENLKGMGEVLENGNTIAVVNYNLVFQQDMEVVSSAGSQKPEETEGPKSVRGIMEAGNDWDKLSNKDNLTLQLKDGRRINFLIHHADSVTGIVRIAATGGFY